MEDEDKMQEEASNEELTELRQRVAELEALETERKQNAEAQRRRQKYLAYLFPGLPLILGLCLFTLNPEYIGRMIFSCEGRGIPDAICSQPCGWLMLGLFIFLVSVSFLGVRGSFALLTDKWMIALLFITLFLILPALFLILLGPAVLVIMETPGFGQ